MSTSIANFLATHLEFTLTAFVVAVFIVMVCAAYLSGLKRRDDFRRATPATARILKVGKSYDSGTYGGYDVDLVLEVLPANAAPYELKTTWSVEPLAVSKLKQGDSLAIRISSKDPQKIYSAVDWAWSFYQTPARYGNKVVIGYIRK